MSWQWPVRISHSIHGAAFFSTGALSPGKQGHWLLCDCLMSGRCWLA